MAPCAIVRAACQSSRVPRWRRSAIWCADVRHLFVWRIVACACLLGAPAEAQTPQAPRATPPPGGWTFTMRDMFRAESWRFFEPAPGGGDPEYVFVGNQLFLQASRSAPRLDATVAVQYVGLAHLPSQATGPGALGTGAL